jgi:uncharacterized protein YdeI (YjbR/CyaY-like superfamily)
MGKKDPRVDAYIAKAQPFARPILTHLRTLVHDAVPDIEETMKWSFPHFMYKGMYASMASFKAHLAFGFWKGKLLERKDGEALAHNDGAMGSFGKIASRADLPSDAELRRLMREAKKLNDEGAAVPRQPKAAPKKPKAAPAELVAALDKNAKAKKFWSTLPPGQQREYIDWIGDAKQEATRVRRLKTSIEWLAEGKRRNWKYETC